MIYYADVVMQIISKGTIQDHDKLVISKACGLFEKAWKIKTNTGKVSVVTLGRKRAARHTNSRKFYHTGSSATS